MSVQMQRPWMDRWMKWRRLQKIDSKNDYPENWNLRKTIVTTFVIVLKLVPTANWFLLGGVISSKFKSMFHVASKTWQCKQQLHMKLQIGRLSMASNLSIKKTA
jgi:hypothetical protein